MQYDIIVYALDDDREDLEHLGQCLKQIPQCHYELYYEIDSFLDAIQQGCHVAIIDYNLSSPGVDGLQIGRMVKQKNPLCFLVMLSGHFTTEIMRRATNEVGFRYFIEKTSDSAQLTAEAGEILRFLASQITYYDKYKKQS